MHLTSLLLPPRQRFYPPDIGPWEAPAAGLGSGFLCGGAPPSRATAAAVLRTLDAPTSPTPLAAFPRPELLDAAQRALLMRHIDGAHQGDGSGRQQHDLQLVLTTQALGNLVGAAAVQALLGHFGSGTVNEIKLRRVEADGGMRVINYHLDSARKTMQVALNGEGEYEGGKLVYITGDGFEQPRRPAGSATIHDNTIVHGVTQLVSGVRYGLFLLHKKDNREGHA